MTEPRWLNADERRAWLAQLSINTLLPAALDTQLHAAGKLSLFDYNVLAMLSEAEGRYLPMSELAARTSASLSRLSHVVTKLQNRGWAGTPAAPRRRPGHDGAPHRRRHGHRSWGSPRAHVEAVRVAVPATPSIRTTSPTWPGSARRSWAGSSRTTGSCGRTNGPERRRRGSSGSVKTPASLGIMESPIDSYLRQIHAEIALLKDGKPYSTIPAMANVDPDNFGIALATVDGKVYEIGDTREEFTIQSISKPFTYGLALEDLGAEAVDAKVDVEPSGDSFNEISLAEGTGRPANAMINAGALTATSLIRGSGGQSGFKRILSTYSAFAGRQLSVNEQVYESELKHGHRNTALAYLLRSFNIIEDDPTPVLQDYFRQCSVLVNCFDLSIMAATLANGGRNPLSGKQVLEIGPVERVLSVMMTSGMYDDAGAWISSVGMPGKSGVAGGIIAVLPGQVGLAVYSPPLDEHGSSVRGLATAQRLSRDMELHFVRAARAGRSAILAAYDVTETPSGIRRNDEAADVLRAHGHRARVIELNGDLLFAGTESMVRELSGLADDVELVVLDMRRTDQVSEVAVRTLARVRQGMADAGRDLVLVEADGSVTEALATSSAAPGSVLHDTERRRRILRKPPAGAPRGPSAAPGPRSRHRVARAGAAGGSGGGGAGSADDAEILRRRRRHPARRAAVRRGLLHHLRKGQQHVPGAHRGPGQAEHAQRRHDLWRTGAGQREPAGNHRPGSGPGGGHGAQCGGDLRAGSRPTRAWPSPSGKP